MSSRYVRLFVVSVAIPMFSELIGNIFVAIDVKSIIAVTSGRRCLKYLLIARLFSSSSARDTMACITAACRAVLVLTSLWLVM